MKQTYIWGIIGIVVVVGLVFLGLSKDTNKIGKSFDRESIDDLLDSDKAYECEVKNALSNDSMGSIYLSGNTFRAEFQTYVPEIDAGVDIFSIWDGAWVYSWSSLSPVGSKAEVLREQISFNPRSQEESDKVVYSCNEVKPDTSKTEVPEDINFEDLATTDTGAVETQQEIEEAI